MIRVIGVTGGDWDDWDEWDSWDDWNDWGDRLTHKHFWPTRAHLCLISAKVGHL